MPQATQTPQTAQTPQAQAPAQPPAGRMGGNFNRPPAVLAPPELDYTKIWVLDQSKLVAILKDPGSSMFQKATACKRLAQIGTKQAIPAMAALLGDRRLGHWARFGMEPNPDPSVDEIFRRELTRLQGPQLIGVIMSIGVRKDAKATAALGKLMDSSDAGVAQAAAASVAMIGGPAAAKLLSDALGRTKPPVLPVVARAALLCAENLMAANRALALEMYSALSATNMPQPVRLAALRILNTNTPPPVGAKAPA